ncbi:MAG: hypothetical protein ABJO72_05010 [Hyphomicrobiales bacterium]
MKLSNFNAEYQALIKELGFSNDLLEDLSKEITENGFAGDTLVPELVYLTLNTSRLKKPASMVIKGPSGAGKSFALDAGKQFVPDNYFEEFNGTSEMAIIYNEASYVHKHIVVGEFAGMASGKGQAMLRQLLSEGEINYLTVDSNSKEGLKSKRIQKDGPTGLIMTTTNNALHPEDESRILSVNITESPEQIKMALLSKILKGGKAKKEMDVTRWHKLIAFNRVGPTKVQIPYLKEMIEYLPLSHDRIKRDLNQVISLIETHALMHCYVRDWVDNETVLASREDYNTVYRLIHQALAEGLQESVSASVRELVEAVTKLSSNPHIGVSQTELAKHLERDQYAVSRTARDATRLGYLKNNNPGQGRKAELVLGDMELPSGSVLPHPKVLFAKPANDNRVLQKAGEQLPW